ncbi:flagellar hook-length control protein FliK [Rhodobacter lacus]|uniref:Flagellar hook-length control protein FliK n=1 Tax=Rhodobacter lacus TaxID=1641972 RepID=A0ABW5A3Z8_9RHOB
MNTLPVSDQMQLFAVAPAGERTATSGAKVPGAQIGKMDGKDEQADFSALFAESFTEKGAKPAKPEADGSDAASWMAGLAGGPALASAPPPPVAGDPASSESAPVFAAPTSAGGPAAAPVAAEPVQVPLAMSAQPAARAAAGAGYGAQTSPAALQALWSAQAAAGPEAAPSEATATVPGAAASADAAAVPGATPAALTATAPAVAQGAAPALAEDESSAATVSAPASDVTAKTTRTRVETQSDTLRGDSAARTLSPQSFAPDAAASAAASNADSAALAGSKMQKAPPATGFAPATASSDAAASARIKATAQAAAEVSSKAAAETTPTADPQRSDSVDASPNLVSVRALANDAQKVAANISGATHAGARAQHAGSAEFSAKGATENAPTAGTQRSDSANTSPDLVTVQTLANDAQKVAANISGATHAGARAQQAAAAAEAPLAGSAEAAVAAQFAARQDASRQAPPSAAAGRAEQTPSSEAQPVNQASPEAEGAPETQPAASANIRAPRGAEAVAQSTATGEVTDALLRTGTETAAALDAAETGRRAPRSVMRGSLAESRFDAAVAASGEPAARRSDSVAPASADRDSQPAASPVAQAANTVASVAATQPPAQAGSEFLRDSARSAERDRREERLERAEGRGDIRLDGRLDGRSADTSRVAAARDGDAGQGMMLGRPPAAEAPQGAAVPPETIESGDSFVSVTGLERGLRSGAAEMGQAAPSGPHTSSSAHHIARQLAQGMPSSPDQPVEISLSPEELGKVRMTLHSSENGITVSVHAERPETLELMRRNIDSLARDFRDMGYSDISFDFANQSGGQQMAQDRGEDARAAPGQPASENSRVAANERAPRFDDTSLALQRRTAAAGGLDLRF